MRWLTESAMHRRRSMISADWKKKRGDFIGAALSDIRLTSAGKRVKASLQLTRHGPGWRATVCMIATEHWPAPLGAHAVARDAAVGGGHVNKEKMP